MKDLLMMMITVNAGIVAIVSSYLIGILIAARSQGLTLDTQYQDLQQERSFIELQLKNNEECQITDRKNHFFLKTYEKVIIEGLSFEEIIHGYDPEYTQQFKRVYQEIQKIFMQINDSFMYTYTPHDDSSYPSNWEDFVKKQDFHYSYYYLHHYIVIYDLIDRLAKGTYSNKAIAPPYYVQKALYQLQPKSQLDLARDWEQQLEKIDFMLNNRKFYKKSRWRIPERIFSVVVIAFWSLTGISTPIFYLILGLYDPSQMDIMKTLFVYDIFFFIVYLCAIVTINTNH